MGKRCGEQAKVDGESCAVCPGPRGHLSEPVGSPKDGKGGVGLATPCCSEGSPGVPLSTSDPQRGQAESSRGSISIPEGSMSLVPNNQTRHELKETRKFHQESPGSCDRQDII